MTFILLYILFSILVIFRVGPVKKNTLYIFIIYIVRAGHAAPTQVASHVLLQGFASVDLKPAQRLLNAFLSCVLHIIRVPNQLPFIKKNKFILLVFLQSFCSC